MADDLLKVLTEFHRNVVRPDIVAIVGDAVEGSERRLRDEMHGLFDSVAVHLKRFETEYYMLVAGVRRIEDRLDAIDQHLDRMALKADLDALKDRVDELQDQIRMIEARLAG